jgi:hypothetical protein
MRYRQCVVAAVLVIGAFASASRAAETFTTIDVPGAVDSTSAGGINARGQLVGGYFDSTRNRGFLLDRGIFSTIDFPGAVVTTLAFLPFGHRSFVHCIRLRMGNCLGL